MQITYADGPGDYRAGACNIGPAEIARRRRSGLVTVGFAVVVAIGLVAVGAPPWTRLIVLLPLAGGIIGLEQARRRFCAGFAMAGIRNFGPLGHPERVGDDADRARDRRSAFVLFGYSSAIAAVITLLFVVLPV
ncbi:MAG: hypothetical protein ACTS8Z_02115 [Candidatus Limnocylindrales bacterium]